MKASSTIVGVALIICPIAIAYSMGQTIQSVCVCQCVSVSISHHLFPYFVPQIPILGQEVLKTHANIK